MPRRQGPDAKVTRPARRYGASAIVLVMSICLVAPLQAQEPPTSPETSGALAEQVEAWCQAEAEIGEAPLGEVALIGQIRDAVTGQPVSEAIVWVRPAGGAFEWIETGPSGVYLLCGLPAGTEFEVQASAATRLSPLQIVALPERGVAVQDLEVSAEMLARARETPEGGPGARLQGVVRSAETGEPLAGARVSLIELGAEQLTGPDGAFFMEAVPLGRYRVVTEYLGMASDTVSVSLLGDVANLALFTLETRPIEVPALNVEVERTYWNPRIQSFYDRVDRGLGDFITREEMWVGDIISNLRRIPGVRVQQCVGGGGFRDTGCYQIRIERGYGMRASCPPHIYLDGHLMFGGGQGAFSRLQSLPRDRIEGIEVHRNPATAPGRYRMAGDACGIILVWTRTGPNR